MNAGPDFMVVGGQRSGTSWLANALDQHPGIASLPLKELHYWDSLDPTHYSGRNRRYRHLARAFTRMAGRRNKADLDWYLTYFAMSMNDRWYRSLFTQAMEAGQVCGDITPGYALLSESTVEHILETFPDIKVVYIARDPIMRAWSHLTRRLARKKGLNPSEVSTDDYLDAIAKVSTVIEKSSHSNIVRKYSKCCREDQFSVMWFDDLLDNSQVFLADFCLFVGASEHSFDLEKDIPRNESAQGFDIPPEVRFELFNLLRDDMEGLVQISGSGIPTKWINLHTSQLT